MDIDKRKDEGTLLVTVKGRLDTTTAPVLEQELGASLDDVTELVLDFSQLDYLSSAGLRVLLAAQKRMNLQGSMVVKNVNQLIMEVFDITGFSGILTIINHEG
ncbi:MAG TPA: STAS domain-containing protein [Clostridia bacterium]|nr:STAS domain-containing protein [Clostridia bacterium]